VFFLPPLNVKQVLVGYAMGTVVADDRQPPVIEERFVLHGEAEDAAGLGRVRIAAPIFRGQHGHVCLLADWAAAFHGS
jgi:hypothetical protein